MGVQNADRAFMAGSDKDTLYLGVGKIDISSVVGLDTAIPKGLKDVGWLSDEGINLAPDDSVDKIRGHQGHGVIRTFTSESSTSVTAQLIEQEISFLAAYWGGVASKVNDIGKLVMKPARSVVRMTGIADLYDVSTGYHRRYLLPFLELGERSEQNFKVGNLTVCEAKLEILEEFTLLTNEPGMIPE